MRYKIVEVRQTDYEVSEDREALQQIADELNRDARDDADPSRWIVVMAEVVGDLFEPTPTAD